MKLFSIIRQRWHPLHVLRRSSTFRMLLRRFDPPVLVRLTGLSDRIYLRLITHSSIILASEAMEPEVRKTFEAVISHIPVETAFWDVGANVGMFTFICASMSPQRPIVSFEPDAKNLGCLKKSAQQWKIRNLQIIEAAVSDHEGIAEFYMDDLSGATGSLEDPAVSFSTRHYDVKPTSVPVTLTTLDAVMQRPNQSTPAVIKIDVEGAELRVIQGAEQVIAKHSPVFFIESFENKDAMMALLSDKGYEFYDTDRLSAVCSETTNFVCFSHPQCPSEVIASLKRLGYPV